MAAVRKWDFKSKFRANAYGWRASSLAVTRLKEAAAEIRSVAKSDPVLAGVAEPVPEHEKEARLNSFIDGLWPGRSRTLRPNTAQELKATALLSMKITEGSAKIRTGGPVDEDEDYALPIWAGVIPVTARIGTPEPDPRNLADVEMPDHVAELQRTW